MQVSEVTASYTWREQQCPLCAESPLRRLGRRGGDAHRLIAATVEGGREPEGEPPFDAPRRDQKRERGRCDKQDRGDGRD